MRYIYVILTVLILSSACKAQSSPNTPPAATLPASPNTPAAVQPTPPPTTIQTTTSHSDETIRVERDAYKEVVKAHQETLTTIKWTIGIILAMFGYVIFRSTREYKEAVIDAKKACEKAEEWEEKARATCNKIDDLVKEKLTEIETKNAEQVKNATEKIDALVKAKLEESTKKIDDTSKKERRVSELWSTAWRLGNEGKYEEACEKYAEIVSIRPEDYGAYNNWGNALLNRAELKGDEKLFEQASQKCAQAIKIKPDMHEAYTNWGSALGYLGKIKNDEKLLEQACQKYNKALNIKPNNPEVFDGLAATLIYIAKLKIGTPEYESLLKQAEEKALKAESIKKGEGAYNLACVCALKGNKEECRKWLLVGQEADTLMTREHAMKDNDLDSVRNEAWFKAIKWKGER